MKGWMPGRQAGGHMPSARLARAAQVAARRLARPPDHPFTCVPSRGAARCAARWMGEGRRRGLVREARWGVILVVRVAIDPIIAVDRVETGECAQAPAPQTPKRRGRSRAAVPHGTAAPHGTSTRSQKKRRSRENFLSDSGGFGCARYKIRTCGLWLRRARRARPPLPLTSNPSTKLGLRARPSDRLDVLDGPGRLGVGP